MTIGEKPEIHTAGHPEVKFSAGIHGDAPVGRELLLELISYLCENYDNDYFITQVSDTGTRSACKNWVRVHEVGQWSRRIPVAEKRASMPEITQLSKPRTVRAVPEIILGEWAAFVFRPLHPKDTHGVGAPRPPGHVSALINSPHYGSNTP